MNGLNLTNGWLLVILIVTVLIANLALHYFNQYSQYSVIEGLKGNGTITNSSVTLSNKTAGATNVIMTVEFTSPNNLLTGDSISVTLPQIFSVPDQTALTVIMGSHEPMKPEYSSTDNRVKFNTNATIMAGSKVVFTITGLKNPAAGVPNPDGVYISTGTRTVDIVDDNTNHLATVPSISSAASASSAAKVMSTAAEIATANKTSVDAYKALQDAKISYATAVSGGSKATLAAASTVLADASSQWFRWLPYHPASWFDGKQWVNGLAPGVIDGSKVSDSVSCTYAATGDAAKNCQILFKRDDKGNFVNDSSGNPLFLMKKCPMLATNPSDVSVCSRKLPWSQYLKDGTRVNIDESLLADALKGLGNDSRAPPPPAAAASGGSNKKDVEKAAQAAAGTSGWQVPNTYVGSAGANPWSREPPRGAHSITPDSHLRGACSYTDDANHSDAAAAQTQPQGPPSKNYYYTTNYYYTSAMPLTPGNSQEVKPYEESIRV